MGLAHRSALRAGLDERLFWGSTPFKVSVWLQEIGRARNEEALLTGWFAERFAREQRLQAPQSYITEMLDRSDASTEMQQEMAEAELTRMALAWGLELEDVEEDE